MIPNAGGLAASILVLLLYAWFLGTLLWIFMVVPRMHKRQREIVRRLEQILTRIDDLERRFDATHPDERQSPH